MRIPRDISGADLVKLPQKFGYENTRQTGSHMRLTTQQNGEHERYDSLSQSFTSWHIISNLVRYR
jgi:hypothetical protein